jgi:nitrate reductase gamma subunit
MRTCFHEHLEFPLEITMYIGGILGTILMIALIIFLVRRI